MGGGIRQHGRDARVTVTVPVTRASRPCMVFLIKSYPRSSAFICGSPTLEIPMSPTDPHVNTPLLTVGPAPREAAGTIIMIHGRGASAESILSLLPELELDRSVAAVAPQAAGNTWYPHSFLAPME